MIPNIIHYCWFGNGEINNLIQKCINSWKTFCPHFEIVCWDEKKVLEEEIGNKYFQEAFQTHNWAFASDFLRLYILDKYGGIYFDTDVELIRNIDDLLNYNGFFCFENDKHINTGLGMGATQGNLFIKSMLDEYEKINFILDDETYDLTPCPKRNSEALEKNGVRLDNSLQIIIDNIFLPNEYFCPLNYHTKKISISKNTKGIHHFNESWKKNTLDNRIIKNKFLILDEILKIKYGNIELVDDLVSKIKCKKLIFYGESNIAKAFIDMIFEKNIQVEIILIVDEYPQTSGFKNIPISTYQNFLKNLNNLNYDAIIISPTQYYYEISKKLTNDLGIVNILDINSLLNLGLPHIY